MKQIKTIADDNPTLFDDQVNKCLADGWILTERKLVQTPAGTRDYFYAELEQEVITEAERCCENCKHYHKAPEANPCFSCSGDASEWEAEE